MTCTFSFWRHTISPPSIPERIQVTSLSDVEFDFVFELTETRRFKPGDPLPRLLQSMRDANPMEGRVVDEALWAKLPASGGTTMSPGSLGGDKPPSGSSRTGVGNPA